MAHPQARRTSYECIVDVGLRSHQVPQSRLTRKRAASARHAIYRHLLIGHCSAAPRSSVNGMASLRPTAEFNLRIRRASP